MRVLLDGRPTQTGFKRHKQRGTGRIAEMLLRNLPDVAPGHEYRVLLDRSKPVEPFLMGSRYRRVVHAVPALFSLGDEIADTHLYLPFTLDGVRADVLHFFAHVDAPVVHAHPNTVVTVLDLIPLALPELYRPERNVFYKMYQRLLRRVVRRAKAVMTISEHSKKDILACFGIADEKVHTVPLGVDSVFRRIEDPVRLVSIREKYGIHRPFVFYVGGIDPRKNVGRLVQAYGEFAKHTGGRYDFVLAGGIRTEAEFPDLERSIRGSGLGDRIRITGFVPLEDLPLLYSSAEMFVFPSLYEGFGLPVLEAMACGTPVVSSNASCMPEVVGDAGLLVDPASVDRMAEAMIRLVRHPHLKRRLVQLGIQRTKQFTWRKTAERTFSLYEKAAGARS